MPRCFNLEIKCTRILWMKHAVVNFQGWLRKTMCHHAMAIYTESFLRVDGWLFLLETGTQTQETVHSNGY